MMTLRVGLFFGLLVGAFTMLGACGSEGGGAGNDDAAVDAGNDDAAVDAAPDAAMDGGTQDAQVDAGTCDLSCGDNAACQDTGSGPACVCERGFEEDAGFCVDIDECTTVPDHCDSGVPCINLVGSSQCQCDGGNIPGGNPCPTPGYDIDLFLGDGVPRTVEQAAEAAAARYEAVVSSDVITALVAPVCNLPADVGVVDDLAVLVEVGEIDGAGGTTATSGVLCLRNEGRLPASARIVVDQADLGSVTQAQLDVLLLHEMGHALGLGAPLWQEQNLIENPSCPGGNCEAGRDPRYLGAAANAAYMALGGSAKAPVENVGPLGTADVHWRELSALGGEIMSSTITVGSALSTVTAGALEDLGYEIAPGAPLDDYTLTGGPRLVQPGGEVAHERSDTTAPWVLDRAGRVLGRLATDHR